MKKMIEVVIILINLGGIFVMFILGVLIFRILNRNVVNKIFIGLFVVSRFIVILLKLIVNEDGCINIFLNVFSFLIILLSFVKVLEIIIDRIIVCFVDILVYLLVFGFKLIEWILNLSVVLFNRN